MADYNFKTWQRMDVNLYDYGGYENNNPIYFLILNQQATGDPSEAPARIYSGIITPDYQIITHLENILSPMITVKHEPNVPFETAFLNDVRRTFWIYTTDDDWQNWYEISLQIEYDWTYDASREYTNVLSNPIEKFVDSRQYLLWTVQPTVPGTYETVNVTVNGNVVYWIEMDVPNFSHTFKLKVSDYIGTEDGTQAVIGSDTFTVKNTCCNYCLYYPNKIGGWNWLLVKGKETKTNKFNRLSYKNDYNPQLPNNRYKVNYTTEISESWQLNTSWLNDIESSQIQDIFSANVLVLHDLVNDKLINVNITNSSVSEKTYLNQGRKMYAYAIEVESANPKYRY